MKCPLGGTVLYLDCLECDDKVCRKGAGVIEMKNKIVVGIDQSYQDTGISIAYNGKIKAITHCYTNNLSNNSLKRKTLKLRVLNVLESVSKLSQKYNAEVMIVIERIRLHSQSPKAAGAHDFINIDYIKSIGALNAMIVDVCSEYNYPVFSVDTRAWKSAVVGNCKPQNNKYEIDPKKWPTIKWLIGKGYEDQIKQPVSKKKRKGVIERNGERYTYNDNAADSAAISLFPFVGDKKLLKEEH